MQQDRCGARTDILWMANLEAVPLDWALQFGKNIPTQNANVTSSSTRNVNLIQSDLNSTNTQKFDNIMMHDDSLPQNNYTNVRTNNIEEN
jgi:hypothetical protein